VVKAGHLRPAADQLSSVKARPAGRVQDPLAGDVSQQLQAGGPVVMGVEEPVLGMIQELISENLVLRLAPHRTVHAALPPAR
jgi:hypothetical protein